MKPILLFSASVFILFYSSISAQPVNDNCATAITLAIPCGTPVNGDLSGATQSDTGVTCNSYTSAEARDVWYQFSGIAGTTYNITVAGSSGLDEVINLRYGSCSSQVSVACADDYFAGPPEVLTFTAAATGMYYVRVYAYMSTPTDTPSTTTFTICAEPVGIDEIQGQGPVSVFPNPTSGKINVSINKAMNNASLVIYNSLGEKIYADTFSGQANFSTELTIKEPPGIYFLEIKDKDNRYFGKLMVTANEQR